MKAPLSSKIFKIVAQQAKDNNVRAYVIGGYVRDYFLKRPSTDIDIVVEGNGLELAEQVGNLLGVKVTQFKNFGTAMFRYRGKDIEFVGARKESYTANSRKPAVENGTVEDDQKRRDFTINTLAFSLQEEDYGSLIDPFNGLEDLRNKTIRTPLDPGQTFSDDPLRMIPLPLLHNTQTGCTLYRKSALRQNCRKLWLPLNPLWVFTLWKKVACYP